MTPPIGYETYAKGREDERADVLALAKLMGWIGVIEALTEDTHVGAAGRLAEAEAAGKRVRGEVD